jgi:hypothetical protein
VTFLAGKLDLSVGSLSRRMDGLRRVTVQECQVLAEWLHVDKDVVVEAVIETARRPGEGDPRGRKQFSKASQGAQKKNGTSIDVGLGAAGNGALAAQA